MFFEFGVAGAWLDHLWVRRIDRRTGLKLPATCASDVAPMPIRQRGEEEPLLLFSSAASAVAARMSSNVYIWTPVGATTT
jgi:hypothetical protein